MKTRVRSIDKSEVSIPLGIVVEKRKSTHPWADWIWTPVSVILNARADAKWVEMVRKNESVRYHAGTLLLTLHRKDTEALRANLMLPVPELYVVLQETEDPNPGFPYAPHAVTASAYDAQDMTDAGDDIVEKVPMPEMVAAFVQAFVEEHHVEEEFIKRKRDRLKLEDRKFGKAPIFTDITRH
ncbi:MAG: DUF3305 domain-containing protein [Rhizobiaceae bacterium]